MGRLKRNIHPKSNKNINNVINETNNFDYEISYSFDSKIKIPTPYVSSVTYSEFDNNFGVTDYPMFNKLIFPSNKNL